MTAISTIADFFQSAFQNAVSSFLQPTYITIASIFLLLNFVFIYPDLVAHDVIYVIYFGSINPILQTMLLTVVALILGYIFLSLNSYFLAFLTGGLWYRSLIGGWLRGRREADRKSLEPESNLLNKKNGMKTMLNLELDTRFPDKEHLISPTSLGNVMDATASYVKRLYGIEMAALWSHMNIVLANAANNNSSSSSSSSSSTDSAATALKTLIDNNKTMLDFLATLAVVLGLFAIETILVQFCWLHDTVTVFWEPFVFFMVAYIVYKAAVAKARAWGDSVEMAFDMYRSQLASHLGLLPFNSADNERDVWKKVSDWLLNGNQCNEVFAGIPPYTASPSGLNIKTSPNITVTSFQPPKPSATPDTTIPVKPIHGQYVITRYVDQYTHYVLRIDKKGTYSEQDMFVLVSDPQIPTIYALPEATLDTKPGIPIKPSLIPTNSNAGADQLFWQIPQFPDDAPAYLDYKLPGPGKVFEIRTRDAAAKQYLQITNTGVSTGYALSITNLGDDPFPGDFTFTVFDSEGPLPIPNIPQYANITDSKGENLVEQPIVANIQDHQDQYHYFKWHIKIKRKLLAGETITLTYL